MWQKIIKFKKENPDRWEQLKRVHPRRYQVLIHYFQIDEARGKRTTHKEMPEQTGVPRVGYYKDQALGDDFLGLVNPVGFEPTTSPM